MGTLNIELNDATLNRLAEVAGRHGVTIGALVASIVEHGIEGEDMRAELRRLRVDIALITQAIFIGTRLEPDHDTAWEWASRELLQTPPAKKDGKTARAQ